MLILMTLVGSSHACDGQTGWDDLVDALRAGAVPELPLADLEQLDVAAKAVHDCPTARWQAWVADGAMALLHGRPDTALGEPPDCGTDPACAALVPTLQEAIQRDRYSSLGHSWLAATVTDREPGELIEARGATAATMAAARAPVGLRWLAATWAGSGQLRNPRATMRALWFDVRRGQFAPVLSRFAPSAEVDPALGWSVDPTQSPHPASANAEALASFAVASPHGALEEADIVWMYQPADAAPWSTVGMLSPSLRNFADTPASLSTPFPGHCRAEVLRRLATALVALRAGDFDEAESEVEAAQHDARSWDIADLDASADLFRIRIALRRDDPEGALVALDQALAVPGIGPGRRDALLRAAAADAHAVFISEDRFATVDQFLPQLVARALAAYSVDAALEISLTTAGHARDLGLNVEALRRIDATLAVVRQAEALNGAQRTALAGRLPEAWVAMLTHPGRIAMRRALVLQMRAEVLTRLGAPIDRVRAALTEAVSSAAITGTMPRDIAAVIRGQESPPIGDEFAKMIAGIDGPALQMQLYLALGDRRSAYAQARLLGPEGNLPYLLASDGDSAALSGIWERTRSDVGAAAALLPTRPERALAEQAISGDLGFLLAVGPRFAPWPVVDEVLRAWGSNTLINGALEHQPWREAIAAGNAAAAKGETAAARVAYDRAVEQLRIRSGAVTRYASDETEAWAGAIILRTEGDPTGAFALADEWRQRSIRRRLGRAPTSASVSLDALPADVTLVSIQALGWQREFAAWVSAPGGGSARRIEVARFVEEPEEPDLPLAIHEAVGGSDPTPALSELLAWVTQRVPPGAPVLLVTETSTRNAGAHLLRLGGRPLALRNPIRWAPSLADAVAAEARAPLEGESVVIATPIDPSDADVDPVLDEAELRSLRVDRLWWGPAATREAAISELGRAASVHFSTHGVVDRLDTQRTGLRLADGILGTTDIRSRMRPGAQVVLSACGSGASGPVETAPLDVAFLLDGARIVVSTPFARVNATATAAWMRAWYRYRREGSSPSIAAWRTYRARARVEKDPLDWGAFILVGAG